MHHPALSLVPSSSLSNLSAQELLRELFDIVRTGRSVLARLIRFLIEMERRDLHNELGHPSLWDFCVRRIGLSEDQASRHVAVAHLARRFPLVLEKLESGA